MKAVAGVAAALILLSAAPAVAAVQVNTSYYVDCSSTASDPNGTTVPWTSLAQVNEVTFGPGDKIYFRSGRTCVGTLSPQGEGQSGSPITIDSYDGTTKANIQAATGTEAAVTLTNQSWWTINNLDVRGGSKYGVFVTVNSGLEQGIKLNYLNVHDVTGTDPESKNTGLVVVSPTHDLSNSTSARFNDVTIDHVTATGSTMWAGIIVGSGTGASWATERAKRSTNVLISNSTVSEILGDGIVLYAVDNGTLRDNTASRTGTEEDLSIGTPNAIWTWACHTCLVEGNTAYDNDSPDVDGGAFDIDYWSENTTVQYNYAYNNSAYCVAVFAANTPTRNSVIRYNVCAKNGTQPSDTHPRTTDFRTEIYLQTWENGTIDGLQIYGNTFITSHGTYQAVNSNTGGTAANMFSGAGTRSFANNLTYATVADPDGAGLTGLESAYNLWYTTAGEWSNNERYSVYDDPQLVDPTFDGGTDFGTAYDLQRESPAIDAGMTLSGITRDYRGSTVPQGNGFDIGALESPYTRG